jgi:glycosyltransferase involved in cell wall biosynthesis
MVKPEVSVIVPVYNGERYIAEAIDSIISQTYQPLEIIVIDDGSTDNTRRCLEPYLKNAQIRYFYQNNTGHGAARNTGIKYSRGTYVCFLDHDDHLEKNSIEKRLHVYKKYPELGLVFSDFCKSFMVNNNFQTSGRERFLQKYNFPDRIPTVNIDDRDNDLYIFNPGIFVELIIDDFVWTGTVMISRKVIDAVGLFDETMKWAEDHDLWIRIALRYNIGFLDTVTAAYRQHTSNICLNQDGVYHAAIQIRTKYLDRRYGLKGIDRKRVRASIGEYYYRIGHQYIGTLKHLNATKNMLQGIKYDLFRFRYYLYCIFSLMPPLLIQMLKKLKTDKAARELLR